MRLLLLLSVLIGSFAAAQSDRAPYSGPPRTQNAPVGSPLWQLDVQRREPDTSSPNSDIVSGDGRVFYLQSGQVKAVDAETGQQVWTFQVRRARLAVGAHHFLVVAQQRTLHVLDARTGDVLWQQTYHAPEGVETFAVYGDLLVVVVGERFIAYELATGRERWRVRGLYGLTQDPHHTVHSASGSVVFLELGYYSLTSSPDVFAFDRTTGKRLWKVWSAFSPLTVISNRVYLLEDNRNMDHDYPGRFRVNAFDLRSGKPLGRRVYNLNSRGVMENLYDHPHPWDDSSVLVHGNTLYVDVKRLGTAQANVARFALGGKSTSRPAFVKPGANLEWLAGPYRGKLFLLGRKNGKHRFRVGDVGGSSLAPIQFDDTYQIGANPISRLDLIGNGLYVGHTDGGFYAVDVKTGRAFFRFKTQAKNFGPSHVVGDTLVIQAGNKLLAFALPEELKP